MTIELLQVSDKMFSLVQNGRDRPNNENANILGIPSRKDTSHEAVWLSLVENPMDVIGYPVGVSQVINTSEPITAPLPTRTLVGESAHEAQKARCCPQCRTFVVLAVATTLPPTLDRISEYLLSILKRSYLIVMHARPIFYIIMSFMDNLYAVTYIKLPYVDSILQDIKKPVLNYYISWVTPWYIICIVTYMHM